MLNYYVSSLFWHGLAQRPLREASGAPSPDVSPKDFTSLLDGQVKFAWKAPSTVYSLFTVASSSRRWKGGCPLHHIGPRRPHTHHAQPHHTSCGLDQFADENVFWFSTIPDSISLFVNLPWVLTDYLAYCNKWRMKVNTAKTQLIFGPCVSGRR